MSIFKIASTITITCHNRIAPYLKQEVSELGYEIIDYFNTGVTINGTLEDCILLNLNIRCGSQVLFSLGKFTAQHPDDIYNYLLDIAWEDILPKNGYFSVSSNVQHPTVNNSMFVNLRVKDAIVDTFSKLYGIRPQSGAQMDGAVFHLYWKNEQAEIFIDTSGESLARHGYRKIPGKAPMLEGLAAATILATNWDRKSPFINPMCGSGTLAIEAALIATNTRPGLFRNNYAFMHLLDYDESFYLDALGVLENSIIDIPNTKIIASDHSEWAIENAKKNAKAAGVADIIQFEVCDFKHTTIPQNEKGIVFLNPEYGTRLGDISELAATYASIGDFFKQNCQGYTGYIFTGNMDLAKKIGLKANRRIEFYNSTIDCRLLSYDLYQGKK